MTTRRPRPVPAATPIKPGVGSYPDLEFLEELQKPLSEDAIEKLNAGAHLFFALYNHPHARELFSSPFMTSSLMKAYMAAQKAWGL